MEKKKEKKSTQVLTNFSFLQRISANINEDLYVTFLTNKDWKDFKDYFNLLVFHLFLQLLSVVMFNRVNIWKG
jgi:hypothetical protein